MRRCPGIVSMAEDGAASSVLEFVARPMGSGSMYGGAVASAGRSCWQAPRIVHRGAAAAAPWQREAGAVGGDAA